MQNFPHGSSGLPSRGEGPHRSVPAWTVSRLWSEPRPHSRGRHGAGGLEGEQGTCAPSLLGPWDACCVPTLIPTATRPHPESPYQPCEVDPNCRMSLRPRSGGRGPGRRSLRGRFSPGLRGTLCPSSLRPRLAHAVPNLGLPISRHPRGLVVCYGDSNTLAHAHKSGRHGAGSSSRPRGGVPLASFSFQKLQAASTPRLCVPRGLLPATLPYGPCPLPPSQKDSAPGAQDHLPNSDV